MKNLFMDIKKWATFVTKNAKLVKTHDEFWEK